MKVLKPISQSTTLSLKIPSELAERLVSAGLGGEGVRHG